MLRTESPSAFLTTREAAKALGISLRTAQLWVENGQLEAWKTEGGHRRITRGSVQRLLRGNLPSVAPEKPEAQPPSPERIKVLIVEDDSILLKLYKTMFASWKLPVDVITAGNGIDGLIRIGKDSPDLMITDLGMPGMDGIQLIRNLVTSSLREGLEIVAVSGLDATEIAARGGLPPEIAAFSKPVPFAQLKSIVNSIVERRSAYL
ncbi:MAG: response regulator [Azonexus sp.]|nr:response regulator [Azonexus sp.]